MRREDYFVFVDKFKPIEDGDETIRKYHWEGEDLEELKKWDEHNIWTVLDCDGKLYISPGMHRVNRMDYIITRIQWKDGQRDYLY